MFKYFQLFKGENDFFHKTPLLVVVSPNNITCVFSTVGGRGGHIFYYLCLPIVKPTLTPGAVRLWDPQRPQSSPRQASVRGWRLRVPGPAFLHPPEGGAALGVRLPAGPGVLHLLPTRMFHLIRAAV